MSHKYSSFTFKNDIRSTDLMNKLRLGKEILKAGESICVIKSVV